MYLKVLAIVALVQATAAFGIQQRIMIKNKHSGKVLDADSQFIKSGDWANKNSQLWTIEESPKSGYYYVHNVANGKILDACPQTKALLSWPKHGGTNQMWKIDTGSGDTKLQVLFYPNDYMTHGSNQPILTTSKPNDDSDKWLLVEPVTV